MDDTKLKESKTTIEPMLKLEPNVAIPKITSKIPQISHEMKIEIEEKGSSASTLPTNARSDWEGDENIRVCDKEIAVIHGLSYLKSLIQSLENQALEFPKFDERYPYRQRAEEILEHAKPPRVLIGLMGSTGSGKSSLINALLDEEMIVPCNAMRASTSVVVEISYNWSDDPQELYSAHIEFVSEDEWLGEFNILAQEIKDRPEGEQLGAKSGSDASVAFAKIFAVYPKANVDQLLEMTRDELLKVEDLSGVLGETIVVQEAHSKAFYKAVNAFIDSNNKGAKAGHSVYWPLVKLVKICTKANVLKTGVVLVDLPGVGDSNASRSRIAVDYMASLDKIWVVADIVRAVDDQVAKELMGNSFKQQLYMDGNYDQKTITFVMTKADNINVAEVVQTLSLEDGPLKESSDRESDLRCQLHDAQDAVEIVKDELKIIMKTLKNTVGPPVSGAVQKLKRKHSETDDNAPSDTPLVSQDRKDILVAQSKAISKRNSLQKKASKLQNELSKTKEHLKTAAIQERNNYTSRRVCADFDSGLREVQQDRKDLDDVGYSTLSTNLDASQMGVNIFCVSSKAYQKINGRFQQDSDSVREGFPTSHHTNIPQLQQFATTLTLSGRERVTAKVLSGLQLLNGDLLSWAQGTETNTALELSQRQQLKAAFDKYLVDLESTCKKHANKCANNIRNSISKNITFPLSQNDIEAWEDLTIQSKEFSSKAISVGTWRAICRRGGSYRRNKEINFSFNGIFLDLFLKDLALPWNKVFQDKIAGICERYSGNIKVDLREFSAACEVSMIEICGGPYAPGLEILQQIEYLETQVGEAAVGVLDHCRYKSKSIHRNLEPLVGEKMSLAYQNCLEIKGKGSLKRMKQIFHGHVEDIAGPMFREAGALLKADLNRMTKGARALIFEVPNDPLVKLRNDFIQMLVDADPTSDPQLSSPEYQESIKSLQSTISGLIQKLEAAWAEELANPKEQLKPTDPFTKEDAISSVDTDGDQDGDDQTDSTDEDNDLDTDEESGSDEN